MDISSISFIGIGIQFLLKYWLSYGSILDKPLAWYW